MLRLQIPTLFAAITLLLPGGSHTLALQQEDERTVSPPLGKELPALAVSINGPSDLAVVGRVLYVMETAGSRIWRFDLKSNTMSLVLPAPAEPFSDDASKLDVPFAVAANSVENVYVADVGGALGKIDFNSHSATILRTKLIEEYPQVHAMVADGQGGILIVDRHSLLRWIPSSDTIELLAGGKSSGFAGDNELATKARFHWPQGIAIDHSGNIFIADTENCRIRVINRDSGMITTLAGNGTCESNGDGDLAVRAGLLDPRALAVDSHRNLFVSEGCRIRKIDAAGVISTYAGSKCGYSGDGKNATEASLNADGLAVDEDGNLYLSDYSHNRIRRIDAATFKIDTIAGDGLPERVDPIL